MFCVQDLLETHVPDFQKLCAPVPAWEEALDQALLALARAKHWQFSLAVKA